MFARIVLQSYIEAETHPLHKLHRRLELADFPIIQIYVILYNIQKSPVENWIVSAGVLYLCNNSEKLAAGMCCF